MANFNKVILIGNLTRDPEIRYTAGGTAVASFGLAVNRKYKQGEETKEETLFVDVKAFGKQAETLSQYMKKGNPIMIDGRLTYRKWEDQSGQARSKHEVVAENFQFLGSKGTGEGRGPSGGPEEPPLATEDEIPF